MLFYNEKLRVSTHIISMNNKNNQKKWISSYLIMF